MELTGLKCGVVSADDVLLDAASYTGCMQQWKRAEQVLLAEITKDPQSMAPRVRAAKLLAIRTVLAGFALSVPAVLLFVLGVLADWPVVGLAGAALLFTSALVLILAQFVIFIVIVIYGN